MADARNDMIDAAERLVAEGGLAAMSLRAVQELAGQRNKSAAQYHFGSRDGLLQAVVNTRLASVNEHRSSLLDELADDADLADLVRVYVEPLAAALADGTYLLRFLHVSITDPAIQDVITNALQAASYREVRSRLEAALEPMPTDLRARRLDQMIAVVLWTLATAESSPGEGLDLDDLVAVATAILDAPVAD